MTHKAFHYHKLKRETGRVLFLLFSQYFGKSNEYYTSESQCKCAAQNHNVTSATNFAEDKD